MVGIGYRLAMSGTASQRPLPDAWQTSSEMTSVHAVRRRSADLGVNAFATSLRCRWCAGPSRLSSPPTTMSHNSPEAMLCPQG